MTVASEDTAKGAAPTFCSAASPKPARPRSASPLTLRLTAEERAKLEELADGMTPSAYVRACVFAEESRRRKKQPKDVIADKRAAAEALALLGQSRIASNLNQLAYHANIGVLVTGETEKEQIAEANAHLLPILQEIRADMTKMASHMATVSAEMTSLRQHHSAVSTLQDHDHADSQKLS